MNRLYLKAARKLLQLPFILGALIFLAGIVWRLLDEERFLSENLSG